MPDEQNPNPPPAPPPGPDPKLTALQAELAKERETRTALEAQLQEATPLLSQFEQLKTSAETTAKELADYKRKEAMTNAIKTAVGSLEPTKTVDLAKVEEVAAMTNFGDDIAGGVAKIVGLLATEKPAPGLKHTGGQPEAGGAPQGPVDLDKLYRENPEAFNAYIKQKTANKRFFGGIS